MEEGVVDKIRAAGGEVYAVTSEPQRLADQAHEHWALNFENIGDPHQEISKICSERGWLTLYANRGSLEFLQSGVDWEIEHPKGFFQPGVLALTRERRVLYRWRSVPSSENLNGTAMRPTPTHVWENTERSLMAGGSAGDALHDDSPVVDQRPPPEFFLLQPLLQTAGLLSPNLSPTHRVWPLSQLDLKRLSHVGFCFLCSGSLPLLRCRLGGLLELLRVGLSGSPSDSGAR